MDFYVVSLHNITVLHKCFWILWWPRWEKHSCESIKNWSLKGSKSRKMEQIDIKERWQPEGLSISLPHFVSRQLFNSSSPRSLLSGWGRNSSSHLLIGLFSTTEIIWILVAKCRPSEILRKEDVTGEKVVFGTSVYTNKPSRHYTIQQITFAGLPLLTDANHYSNAPRLTFQEKHKDWCDKPLAAS